MGKSFMVYPLDGDPAYKATYKQYIGSRDWWQRATKFKEEAGSKCEDCGLPDGQWTPDGERQVVLHVHHKHYRTLGRERREDVEVVCNFCHPLRHPKWR